eukprot:656174-Ditylum_brightwellii.AAC.1
MAAPALTADQIAAIAAAAIQAAGLTLGEQSFMDNLFAGAINPATKNRLLLFNVATAAVASEKRILMDMKNLQKLLDFLRIRTQDINEYHLPKVCQTMLPLIH